jgi:hypothetical protein
MTEKINNQNSNERRYVGVKTNLTLDEYLSGKQPVQRTRQPGYPQQPPQYGQPQHPQQYFPPQHFSQPTHQEQPVQAPEVKQVQKPLTKPNRTLVRAVLAVAGVGVIAGGGYATNIGNIQEVVASIGQNSHQQNSLEITPLETLGEKSLSPDQCKDPNAVLMVATVSGSLPLVPLLASTENPTPTKVSPYLNDKNKNSLPRDQQEKFSNFITDSHYPEATLNDIPLALAICEPTGANAITEQDGALTINRSALEVSFEDPNGLFQTNINAVLQVEGAGEEDVDVNPNKGEFMTLPNPANNMFLSPSADEVYNKSITDMMASMQTPQQLQVILASMEVGAIQQLDNVVDGHENIKYPENANTLQQAIDKALVKRLVGDAKVSPIFTGNYGVQMDVPKDPNTKQPITSGASPLKGIDPTQKFNISSIDIQYGAITPPEVQEEPEPTPTITNEPQAIEGQ